MGLTRWLWRRTRVGITIDTVKNIVEESSVVDGVKRTLKEELTEDNPVTVPIYRMGKFDGKKEGYVEASMEYEYKLLMQADEFLNQKEVFETERDAYEALLTDYENEISLLEEKIDKTIEENEYLQQLLLRERQLKRMVG